MTPGQVGMIASVHAKVNGAEPARPPEADEGTVADLLMLESIRVV